MAKSASKDLFQLIKSLTKSEKRYITLSAKEFRTSPKYILLFDTIDKMSSYDESQLANQLKIKKPHQLKDQKLYLYEYILKCLRLFNSKSSITLEINELLQNIELLFKKGLFNQAHKVLKRAKSLATTYELFPTLLDIASWETSILIKESSITTEKGINTAIVLAEQKETLHKLNNAHEYYKLMGTLVTMWDNFGTPRNASDLKKYEKLMSSKYFIDPSLALSTRAYNLYLNGNVVFNQFSSNYKKAIIYTRKRVALVEEKPAIFTSEPLRMLNIYCNHIDHCIMLNCFEEAAKHNEHMFKLNIKEISFVETKNMRYLSNEATIRFRSRQYKETTDLIKHLNLLIDIDSGVYELENLKNFYFTISTNYFVLGDLKNAQTFLNKILQNSRFSSDSIGFYGLYQIVALIYRFESGDATFLEYLSRSTERHLKKKKQFYKLEQLVTSFIKTTILKEGSPKTREVMQQIIKELEDYIDKSFKNIHLTCFDFIAWMKSKLKNTSMLEEIKLRSNF